MGGSGLRDVRLSHLAWDCPEQLCMPDQCREPCARFLLGLQEPLMNATSDPISGAAGGGSGGGAAAAAAAAAAASSGAAAASNTTPSESQPLPNPWAAPAGAGGLSAGAGMGMGMGMGMDAGAGAGLGAGLGAAGGFPAGLGGLGLPGMGGAGQPNMDQVMQMMQVSGRGTQHLPACTCCDLAPRGLADEPRGCMHGAVIAPLPHAPAPCPPPSRAPRLQTPGMADMMASMMSQPGMLDAMIASNPTVSARLPLPARWQGHGSAGALAAHRQAQQQHARGAAMLAPSRPPVVGCPALLRLWLGAQHCSACRAVQMSQMVDANPGMRALLSNPEAMRQMFRPESMQAMTQMYQQMQVGACGRGRQRSRGRGCPWWWGGALVWNELQQVNRQCQCCTVVRLLWHAIVRTCSRQPCPAAACLMLLQSNPMMAGMLGMGGAGAGMGGAGAGMGGVDGAAAAGGGAAPDLSALMAAMGAMGAGGGAAAGGAGNPGLAGLQQLLGGMGAGGMGMGMGGFGVPPPVANPEEAYADQLTQLEGMGFFDRQTNIQVLQATGGNVNAAVDRLLQM